MQKPRVLIILVTITTIALLAWPAVGVLAGTFTPIIVTDQTPTAPLSNPAPSTFQPRYISGFGSDDSFTLFFEDRDAGGAISYASTTSGATGFPPGATPTNIVDTHFVVKDWPIEIAGTLYAYRAWGSVGNNPDHHFYVSNNLTNWTLISTFTIANAPSFTNAHGFVYYGFHDVIELNGTYYAFAESNQSQTMFVRSANGDDVWEAFASVGGRPGDGPLELPSGVSAGWTPSGSFVDLGHDRGYGKIHADPRDSDFYLAVNTLAKSSLSPAALEAAFINPANWTWHDGTTGPAANPILSQTSEHDLRECWVVPNTDLDADWVIVYDADFGSADGGKALGYATLTLPPPPPNTVWVDDDYNATSCTDQGHTWQVDCFDAIHEGLNAVAAGGTVYVAGGMYDTSFESFPIVINKPITLLGAQAGVDPRPSFGSTRVPGLMDEAIVDGGGIFSNIFTIYADDVTLDGLEVRNGTGDLITSPDSSMQYRPTVRYSIIHNSSGDEGIQLKRVTDAMIEYNYIFTTQGDGINIGYTSWGGTIRHNEVYDIYSPDGGIYVYQTPEVTIECNLVYDIHNNDGIKLGSKNGSDAALTGGSILYNTVYNTAQDGVALYMSDTLIEGNKVHHSTSENGAIYLAYGISNITVTLNDVHDNTLDTGKWGDPGAIMIGTAVDAATVSVSGNNIYGNSPNGLTNKAPASLNATGNWWGADDGPSGQGAGSGDAVSPNVDFSDWLVDPVTILNPCIPDGEGPLTSNVAAAPNPVAVNESVNVTATVDDTETGGSSIASAEYSLDGEAWAEMGAQDGQFDGVIEGVEAISSAPGEAGIYNLCVRGTDVVGNTGPAECIMLVVYDPDGGFVTGGGWIESPEGAYTPDPSLTGKANFGFVSKYKKGADTPTGNTEFVFQAADLNFHSASYDWLVVTGNDYARYKGSGTINGLRAPNEQDYKFMLWAGDGTGSDGADTFRIKIWWEEGDVEHVVYDNGMDQAISGGNIVVHTKK